MVDNIENLTIEELKIKINELKLRREEIKNEILLRKERNSMNTLTAALCTLYVSVSSLLCNYQTALVSLLLGSTVTYLVALNGSKKIVEESKNLIDDENDINKCNNLVLKANNK